MRKKDNKKENKKLIVGVIALLVIALGIGYAVLSQRLKVEGNVNYDTMAWDVGFNRVSDGNGTINANPVVSEDQKTVTITCNLEKSLNSETCIAKVEIKNDSTFDINVSEEPVIDYEKNYIESVTVTWQDNGKFVENGDVIDALSAKEVLITITTKKIEQNNLPTSGTSEPVSVTINWGENK